jgi:ribose transport system ATP-binding protein
VGFCYPYARPERRAKSASDLDAAPLVEPVVIVPTNRSASPVHSASPAQPGAHILEVQHLSKTFQGQRALTDVGLALQQGEVHALLGQNGSGKSTLIKILAGYHLPDAGSASVRGGKFDLGSASAAHAAGLRFIHQDLAVIDTFDVVDNLALGEHYSSRWWLSGRRERRAARATFAAFDINVDVDRPLVSLDPAQRTMTAIVRALHHGNAGDGILVLDEPTASLTETDKEKLFKLIRLVRDRGETVLYVTHRLQEVFEIADRVTVLRNGRVIATQPVAALDHDGLIELIIGRPLEALYPETPAPRDDVALELTNIAGGPVRDASLRIHAGEIVGVTGLTGSGVDELLHLVFGSRPRSGGGIEIKGRSYTGASPSAAVRAGMAFAPADRKRLGGMPAWTLRENVTLPRLRASGPQRWLSARAERRDARTWLQRFDVVPDDTDATFSSLSGGNQQKVVLAKWMRSGASLFLLAEPTQGVDIGGKRAIYNALTRVTAGGSAVLMSSSDFEEVCSVCDRVVVMRHGRVGAILENEARTVENVLTEVLRVDRQEADND